MYNFFKRRIYIDYYGGTLSQADYKLALDNLISRIESCSVRNDENFGHVFQENVVLMNRMYQLILQIQNNQSHLQNKEIRHLIETTSKLTTLDWSAGHTLYKHYHRRNFIPDELAFGNENVLGVWHDEKIASQFILHTIKKKQLQILHEVKQNNKVVVESDIIEADEFRKNVSVFIRVKKGLLRFFLNEKTAFGKDSRIQPNQINRFFIRVVLIFNADQTRMFVLTAYPVLCKQK